MKTKPGLRRTKSTCSQSRGVVMLRKRFLRMESGSRSVSMKIRCQNTNTGCPRITQFFTNDAENELPDFNTENTESEVARRFSPRPVRKPLPTRHKYRSERVD